MGIKENVEAAALADLRFEDLEKEMGDQIDRFWERMAELCLNKLPPKKQLVYSSIKDNKPMNEIMAASFEKVKIPWGEYKGAYVGQVRLDYLTFLAEDNEFTR